MVGILSQSQIPSNCNSMYQIAFLDSDYASALSGYAFGVDGHSLESVSFLTVANNVCWKRAQKTCRRCRKALKPADSFCYKVLCDKTLLAA